MLKNKLFFIISLLVCFCASSQEPDVNRYIVFLLDKDTAFFSEKKPQTYLSTKAIQRRSKQGIPITPQDFPVNSQYLADISSTGADVYFSSKWYNAALVQMDKSLVSTVRSLAFVVDVDYVADGSPLSRVIQNVEIPENFMEPPFVQSNSSLQNAFIGSEKMHEDGYSGQGITIAVFDNGFKGVNKYKPFQHVFDNNKLVASRDFFGNTNNVFQYGTHGTQVLSCIGANYESSLIGTAPDASFILCVTEEAGGEYRIEEYNWLLAAEFADSIGVDVINNSLGYSYGFTESSMNYSVDDLDGKTTIITQAANIAASKGIVVVTSAGNEGNNEEDWNMKITPPSDSKAVLAVGSITKSLTRSSFSSFGPTADGRIKPDVVTLGSNVAVMIGNGVVTTSSGTSFSAPQIAGFAACVWQRSPEFNSIEVIEAIKLSGNNALKPDTVFGYGIPNYLTMKNNGVLFFNQILNSEINVYPNPFTDNKITIDMQGAVIEQSINIKIIDNQGRPIFIQKVNRRNTPDQLVIEFDAQSEGVYYLTVHSKKFQKTIKLIKI